MFQVVLQGAFAPQTLEHDFDCEAAFKNLKKGGLTDRATVALIKTSRENDCFSMTYKGKNLSGHKYQIRYDSEITTVYVNNKLQGVNLN